MLVFVDESGDTGTKLQEGSSEFLVVTLVITTPEQADALNARINLLRTELNKPANFEFHFKKNSDHIRDAFFKAVAPLPFAYTGIIVNKARLHTEGHNPATFYRDVCGQVFEQARPLLRDALVKIDRSGGEGFRRELATHLRRNTNDPATGICHIKQVSTAESKNDNLIQTADMVCGAIARSCRTDRDNPERFKKIIAHRVFTVRYWP